MSPDDRAPNTGKEPMSTPHDPALPDEGMIHEWLDGQLDEATSAQLEALVARSPEFAARVAEARGFIAASSRILAALDEVPADVLPRRADTPTTDRGVRSITDARPRGPTFAWQRWASAAAVLLVAVSSTLLWQRTPTSAPASAVMTDGISQPAEAAPLADAEPVRTAAPMAVARSAPAPAAPTPAGRPPAAPAPAVVSDVVAASATGEAVAEEARVSTTEAAKAAPLEARVRGGIAAGVEGPMRRSAEVAPALAPAAPMMARSLGAVSDAPTALTDMPSDLEVDDLAFAVQRVECAPQCRQRRVEIARDGRLRRWTSTLGRSSTPDTGRVAPTVLTELTALADSLSLDTLPAVVPLMGAQCRTVGALRESLRLEFRVNGQRRAVTALPWCDAPEHPLAIMARALERAAEQPLGAPSP